MLMANLLRPWKHWLAHWRIWRPSSSTRQARAH